ncbi:MAG TPA: hypothetical protein VH165_18160 [Kofleriaceae bacterium]|nr:hypothetical protein [Kofleriaceae bacterium]
MRGLLPFCLLAAACTTETPNPPDAATGNHPPPRVIAGGGIGDGAIDGVVNLYVVDDATRMPIPGATVRIGTGATAIDGMTDPTGLFSAQGVTGPQTVIAKATGYRSALWIGANGANLTIDLQTAVAPDPGHANLSGQITGFAGITVPAGHTKLASVTYAQSDTLGDAANNLKTDGNANTCAAAGCPFTVNVRTGQVGLLAAIFDVDTKGTQSTADDTATLIRFAYRGGITVVDGVDQAAQDLTLIDPASTSAATIAFGTPPAALTSVAALVGIETADGVYQVPVLHAPTETAAFSVPALAAMGSTGYRLTGIAQTTAGDAGNQSVVLRHAQPTATLAAGTWLAPLTGTTVSRTAASWTAEDGATVIDLEYTQGSATVTHLLDVTVLDGSTSVAIPDLVALPATGVLDAKLSAFGTTGLDVTSFGLDADRDKLDRIGAQPTTISD